MGRHDLRRRSSRRTTWPSTASWPTSPVAIASSSTSPLSTSPRPGGRFEEDGRPPTFRYRDLEDDPAVAAKRLAEVRVQDVADPILASLLLAKQRELRLQLEMLSSRGSDSFLGLSIELYGTVTSELARRRRRDPAPGPTDRRRRRVRGSTPKRCARRRGPSSTAIGRSPPTSSRTWRSATGSTGVMVSNGDVLIAPTCRVPVGADRGAPAPRGRHPRRHPRERRPPAPPRPRQRSGRARRDAGGPGGARRAPRRRPRRRPASGSWPPGSSPCT